MTIMFDTLKYTKTLISAGEKPEIAEAHLDALKSAMSEAVATQADVKEAEAAIRGEIKQVDAKIDQVDAKIDQVETSLRGEIKNTETVLRGEIKAVETALRSEIREGDAMLRGELLRLNDKFDHFGNSLMIRLGGLIIAGIGALAVLMKLI